MHEHRGVIAVFAKPPRPGEVKTRLASSVGPEPAAMLARAFFEDTWREVGELAWARRVLASTSEEVSLFGLEHVEVWLQGEGDLGARQARIAARALEIAPFVLAIGSDSPGLPRSVFEAARAALIQHDAVIGPAEDGGYYLLGLRRSVPGLFDGLPWSSPTTFETMKERLASRGFSVTTIQRWFDVDEAEDLTRLARALETGEIDAPRTAEALAVLGLR